MVFHAFVTTVISRNRDTKVRYRSLGGRIGSDPSAEDEQKFEVCSLGKGEYVESCALAPEAKAAVLLIWRLDRYGSGNFSRILVVDLVPVSPDQGDGAKDPRPVPFRLLERLKRGGALNKGDEAWVEDLALVRREGSDVVASLMVAREDKSGSVTRKWEKWSLAQEVTR